MGLDSVRLGTEAQAAQKPRRAAGDIISDALAAKDGLHVVEPGETARGVAKQHDIPWQDFKRWNAHVFTGRTDQRGRPRAKDGTRIYPGDELRIKAPGHKADHPTAPADPVTPPTAPSNDRVDLKAAALERAKRAIDHADELFGQISDLDAPTAQSLFSKVEQAFKQIPTDDPDYATYQAKVDDMRGKVEELAHPKPAAPTAEQILKDFNQAILPVGDMLAKGKAKETTLADREALVTKANEALQQANALLPKLDPNTQVGARALLNSYQDHVASLADRAGGERADFTKATAAITADGEKLTKTAAAKDKGELRKHIDRLNETYKNPDDLGKDLPPDCRAALKVQANGLMKQVRNQIARNSDSSDIDSVDNGYLLGRPGPKFKKNLEALEKLLQASPPAPDLREQAVERLNNMAEAIKDFDDPTTKASAQGVYDEISKTVFAKLSAG